MVGGEVASKAMCKGYGIVELTVRAKNQKGALGGWHRFGRASQRQGQICFPLPELRP